MSQNLTQKFESHIIRLEKEGFADWFIETQIKGMSDPRFFRSNEMEPFSTLFINLIFADKFSPSAIKVLHGSCRMINEIVLNDSSLNTNSVGYFRFSRLSHALELDHVSLPILEAGVKALDRAEERGEKFALLNYELYFCLNQFYSTFFTIYLSKLKGSNRASIYDHVNVIVSYLSGVHKKNWFSSVVSNHGILIMFASLYFYKKRDSDLENEWFDTIKKFIFAHHNLDESSVIEWKSITTEPYNVAAALKAVESVRENCRRDYNQREEGVNGIFIRTGEQV